MARSVKNQNPTTVEFVDDFSIDRYGHVPKWTPFCDENGRCDFLWIRNTNTEVKNTKEFQHFHLFKIPIIQIRLNHTGTC